jgi:hypothetical protein
MRRILAPHKEQDGWVYVRVSRAPQPDDMHVSYNDTAPTRRIIPSRRVEEAVEIADYLKRCAEEGLAAMYGGDVWVVGVWCYGMPTYAEGFYLHKSNGGGAIGYGDTLREAYHRYHAAVSD